MARGCPEKGLFSFIDDYFFEKDRRAGLFVPGFLVCDALGGEGSTLSRTSGGVKVKMPSRGTLTPRPIRRLRLM